MISVATASGARSPHGGHRIHRTAARPQHSGWTARNGPWIAGLQQAEAEAVATEQKSPAGASITHDILIVGIGTVAQTHLDVLLRLPSVRIVAGVDPAVGLP